MANLKESQKRQFEYLTKILGAIQEGCFDEDSHNFIDTEDFKDSDKLTDFIYAVGSIVPARVYNEITGDDVNYLDFNHIVNKLCFQNMHTND